MHDQEEELMGAFLAGMEAQQEAESRRDRGPAAEAAASEREKGKGKGEGATARLAAPASSSSTGAYTGDASGVRASSDSGVLESELLAVDGLAGSEERGGRGEGGEGSLREEEVEGGGTV